MSFLSPIPADMRPFSSLRLPCAYFAYPVGHHQEASAEIFSHFQSPGRCISLVLPILRQSPVSLFLCLFLHFPFASLESMVRGHASRKPDSSLHHFLQVVSNSNNNYTRFCGIGQAVSCISTYQILFRPDSWASYLSDAQLSVQKLIVH